MTGMADRFDAGAPGGQPQYVAQAMEGILLRNCRHGGLVLAGVLALACSPLLKSKDSTFFEAKSGGGDAALEDSSTDEVRFDAYLKAPVPSASSWFGYTVAVGGGAVGVTAPLENIETDAGVARRGGAAYVFERTTGGLWSSTRLFAQNVATDDGYLSGDSLPAEVPKNSDWSATRIALDERVVVVSATGEDSATTDQSAPESGAVYAYERSALGASPQYIKTVNPRAGDLFGLSLSLSGSLLAIGAPGEDSGRGSVHLYERRGTRFEPLTVVTAPNPDPGDFFGSSVAIAGDLLIVGAPTEDGNGQGIGGDMSNNDSQGNGAVYVFRSSIGGWYLEAYVKPDFPSISGFFGTTLSLSGDTIAIGAPDATSCGGDDAVGALRGTVYVVRRNNGIWSTEKCLRPRSLGLGILFGWGVALSGDKLAVGAPFDASGRAGDPLDHSASVSGAVYLFERDTSSLWVEHQYIKAPNLEAHDVFGNGLAMSEGLLVVGAPRESGSEQGVDPTLADNRAPESGAAYLYTVSKR